MPAQKEDLHSSQSQLLMMTNPSEMYHLFAEDGASVSNNINAQQQQQQAQMMNTAFMSNCSSDRVYPQ